MLITPCYPVVSKNIIAIFPHSYGKNNGQGTNYGCSQAHGTFKLYFKCVLPTSTQGAQGSNFVFQSTLLWNSNSLSSGSLPFSLMYSIQNSEGLPFTYISFLLKSFIWWLSASPVLGCFWPETIWLKHLFWTYGIQLVHKTHYQLDFV